MSQQIINTGNVINDGSGESLKEAFVAINANFAEIYATGLADSQVVITGNTIGVTGTNNNLVLAGNGIGNVQSNSSIQPNIDRVHDIGSPTRRFDTVYAAFFVGNVQTSTLSVTGNISAGNVVTAGAVTGATVSASGTVSAANVMASGSISVVGEITAAGFNGFIDGGNANSF
jgi:hypothetical protein